ncbi:hypothetical protein CRM22_001907 [Opisthorchis felineus]|uniref:Uncharacterized protein n=1 Tax=Opisthorchis felineus TaxID=147828 RepID=A0A4S2M8Q6_OPIFE|nr:hypothetical protein CRM22_001907 [Opisthorchis felineus]
MTADYEETEIFDYVFKIILVGDLGVGKTTLLSRFTGDKFSFSSAVEDGMRFVQTNISVGDIIVQTRIWDVTGGEECHSLPGKYFEGAHGALIVYDITKSETFENVTEWLSEIHRCTNSECVVLLTGNKCDLDENRTVLARLAEQFARSVQMSFIETSARHGDNVETAFKRLISECYERKRSNGIQIGD